MKGLFLVFIIILLFIKYSYKFVSENVTQSLIYEIGVYKNSLVDKKYAAHILTLAEERDINIIVREYDSYFELIEKCNTYNLDFAIVPENYFIDACLGLNVYKDKKYVNNNFVIGLYFNYFYLISDIFYLDENKTKKMLKFSDISKFKKENNRNYIIGTDASSSMVLYLILYIFNLNPISFDLFDKNTKYEDNDVFILKDKKKGLYNRFLEKRLDGVFSCDIQNSRFISSLVKDTNGIFINFDFEITIFDAVFSNYYSKKTLEINPFYTSKIHSNFTPNSITPRDKITYYNNNDLDEVFETPNNSDKELQGIITNLGSFNTRSIRNVLIANNKISSKLTYDISKIIMQNNNFLINKILFNKFSNVEHNLFEPVDIVYVDKNIRYHEGSRKLFNEMKFITFDKGDLRNMEVDSDEKYNYYWKYSKIGLNQFKFDI